MQAIKEDLNKRRISGKAMVPRLEVLRNASNASSLLASSSVTSGSTPKISPVRADR